MMEEWLVKRGVVECVQAQESMERLLRYNKGKGLFRLKGRPRGRSQGSDVGLVSGIDRRSRASENNNTIVSRDQSCHSSLLRDRRRSTDPVLV